MNSSTWLFGQVHFQFQRFQVYSILEKKIKYLWQTVWTLIICHICGIWSGSTLFVNVPYICGTPRVLGCSGERPFIFTQLGRTSSYFKGAEEQAQNFGELGNTVKIWFSNFFWGFLEIAHPIHPNPLHRYQYYYSILFLLQKVTSNRHSHLLPINISDSILATGWKLFPKSFRQILYEGFQEQYQNNFREHREVL